MSNGYRSGTKKYSGSFYTSSGRRVRQHGGQQGQGSMNAFYSGASQLVRHSVDLSQILPSQDEGKISDGTAVALPLVVYQGSSGNTSANPSESVSPIIAEGSRVNNVQIEMQITQSDTTKPNNCYIGFIATSFSDGALTDDNMELNFADLISMENKEAGYMGLSLSEKAMTLKSYNENPFQKHWIRGFNKFAYTLYSGRPAILKTVLPTPPKCRRGQFGMGWWIVIMNDSGQLQGEASGSGTDINFNANTYFKEIQDIRAEYRPAP
jgi:hypothetical protein